MIKVWGSDHHLRVTPATANGSHDIAAFPSSIASSRDMSVSNHSNFVSPEFRALQ